MATLRVEVEIIIIICPADNTTTTSTQYHTYTELEGFTVTTSSPSPTGAVSSVPTSTFGSTSSRPAIPKFQAPITTTTVVSSTQTVLPPTSAGTIPSTSGSAQPNSSGGPDTAIIAGGVAGGVLVVLLAVILAVCLWRHHKRGVFRDIAGVHPYTLPGPTQYAQATFRYVSHQRGHSNSSFKKHIGHCSPKSPSRGEKGNRQ